MATAAEQAEDFEDAEQEAAAEGIDNGTILGILAGVALMVVAIIRGGDAGIFINLNSALIVLGGVLTTAFIAFPTSKVGSLVTVIIKAFRPDVLKPSDYVDEIMHLAGKYRSGGMKQLENEEAGIENRFLKNGIAMIVDGYNAREIHEIMERELTAMVDRHSAGHKILRFMGVQAPVFGMAGTLIGLVQMLMHIDDPSTIGPALATALITTFYGLILANLIVTPVTTKLSVRTEMEANLVKTIRVGIIGIHDRLNPQKIQRNMNSTLPPGERK